MLKTSPFQSKSRAEQILFHRFTGLLHACRLSSRHNHRALSSPRLLRRGDVDSLHFARAATARNPHALTAATAKGRNSMRRQMRWRMRRTVFAKRHGWAPRKRGRDETGAWKMLFTDCSVCPVFLWLVRRDSQLHNHRQHVPCSFSQVPPVGGAGYEQNVAV